MKLLAGAALALLIVWVYAPSLRGGLVYEDYRSADGCGIVLGDSQPVLSRLGLTGRGLTRASWCWQASDPFALRVVNLGLHLTVTALVAALAWSLTRERVAAFLAAAFFGLNAVNVEAVAYLSSRGELLAAIGVLGACLAALSGRWAASGALALFGYLGKESAVVVVLLAPVVLWYQSGRAWAWVGAGAGIGLAVAIAYLTSRWFLGPVPARGAWALVQTSAVARVTLLAVLPFGQTVDYDYLRVPVVLQVWSAVMVLSGLIWAVLQRRRVLLCGVVWVACACAPRLLVPTPESVFSEHQFYLPLVGVSLILASLLTQESHGHHCAAL